MAAQDIKLENFEDRLKSIELRLANLESALSYKNPDESAYYQNADRLKESSSLMEEFENEEKGIEFSIGRVGLAWLGNIVLLFAVIFFTEYIIILGDRLLSYFIGFLLAAGVYILSNYLKKSNTNLSFMLKMNSQVILFYETLRIYFFAAHPLIQSKALVLAFILLIAFFQGFIALRNKSQTFGFLAVLFAVLTSILSDSTHILLPIITITAIVAIFSFTKFDWRILLIVSIFLVYTAFFLWLFGNPAMNHPFRILADHNNGYIYLFAIGGSYSLLPLLRRKDGSSDDLIAVAIILNGLFFTLALTLITTKYFSNNYVVLFSLITLCCLIYSVILKSASEWKFPSAFYALYGFVAMSISLYGMVGFPKVYLLLSVQSLIVVSMALWFNNRLMIIMNSLLFLTILMVYQFFSKSVNGVNFAFAFVPLVSARIINWQKDRLHIKTELIRNLYLVEGFIMVLYALYHGVPKQFVTLSWTVAALIYFLLSFLLKNIKYRYMALGTMISATLYLFIVDLASIEILYRVVALLFLAIVSIGISIYYSNRVKRSAEK